MIAAAGALWGCTGVAILNTLEPTAGVVATPDIAFGSGPRDRLDVYRPADAAGHAPVVVFFYGGGWDSGRRQDYAFLGRALARRGIVVVIPDYRLYPEARWPDFLHDAARAVAWARAHAADYGGDPARLFLMGHSAGAYNAVMLATDRRWLAAEGLDPSRDLAGAIGLAGPYDFLPLHSERLKAIFGPEARLPDTQPINHVDGRGPPLLLATDDNDTVVGPGNTARMADKVRAAGGRVETRSYSGLSHALLIGVIAAPLRRKAPVLDDVVAFVTADAVATPAQ